MAPVGQHFPTGITLVYNRSPCSHLIHSDDPSISTRYDPYPSSIPKNDKLYFFQTTLVYLSVGPDQTYSICNSLVPYVRITAERSMPFLLSHIHIKIMCAYIVYTYVYICIHIVYMHKYTWIHILFNHMFICNTHLISFNHIFMYIYKCMYTHCVYG